jgi:hypothetical protein
MGTTASNNQGFKDGLTFKFLRKKKELESENK